MDLYRETAKEAGIQNPQVGINSHVYVADSSQQAGGEFFPAYAAMMNRIGRERGWAPVTRDQFDDMRSQKGSLVVGSPDQVIEKILFEHSLFGNTRFLAQMSLGNMPHEKILRAIELFGTKVAPVVRKELNQKQKAAPKPLVAPATR